MNNDTEGRGSFKIFSGTGKNSIVTYYQKILKRRTKDGYPCVGIKKRIHQLNPKIWRVSNGTLV